MSNSLVIFCDDLRVKDNPALASAALNDDNIIPFFVYDENYLGRKIGAAAKVFLHYALNSLQKLLRDEYGVELLIRKGDGFSEISKIIAEAKITAIYFNESYAEAQILLAKKISEKFPHLKINSYKAKLLFRPTEIKTGKGEYFKVFTPFLNECLRKTELIGEVFKAPKKIKSQHNLKNISIDDLCLLPKREGLWYIEMIKKWQFDYKKVADNLLKFLNQKLKNYSQNRNLPFIVGGNSQISPYLRFGMISIRALFYEASRRDNSTQFVTELIWREFAYHINYFCKDLWQVPAKKEFANFEWENDVPFLQKWQKGETGFDIVDAGMKELYATGFMHNRVRMITASFLVKDLLIDWRRGEEWFWECLIDADPAVNPFSWQWVFGSGFDAAPYFRIFNPDLQQERFDPDKIYCKKWLGKNRVVKKIVDHAVRRQVALARYKSL